MESFDRRRPHACSLPRQECDQAPSVSLSRVLRFVCHSLPRLPCCSFASYSSFAASQIALMEAQEVSILLLGDAEVGKTTFLSYVQLCLMIHSLLI